MVSIYDVRTRGEGVREGNADKEREIAWILWLCHGQLIVFLIVFLLSYHLPLYPTSSVLVEKLLQGDQAA